MEGSVSDFSAVLRGVGWGGEGGEKKFKKAKLWLELFAIILKLSGYLGWFGCLLL